ncbi:coiled-coil domain-containing protein 166-like [Tiliqua scincoides]|uniref:coiled-coil domain-containing protein 166-like n=1 Tax=Tiliqua scincoides TaxID=71010 RepID=UPI003463249D
MAPKRVKSREKKALGKEQSTIGIPLTDKEQYLQKEYGVLTEHVDNYTQRMEHFQDANDSLDKEAQEIRENTKAYLAYINRHNLRCQNAIITLNDQNRSDLEQVQKQKHELFSQYTDKEKEVKCQLTEMAIKYNLMNDEIDALQPFKELQSSQQTRIRELEKELLMVKIQHSEHMQKVKTRFLQQKTEYELESQEKVEALAKRAEKEAVRSLIQHAKQIKAENWQLRSELLNLIQRAEHLRARMNHLLEQREQLLRELQYSQDLECMHPWLSQRPASSGHSLRDQLSAKDRLHSYHVLSVLPPIEHVRVSQTSIPQPAKSFSQAKLAKAHSVVPLVPSGEDSSALHTSSLSDTQLV